ncbi:hypothetical protein BDR04DRAFT_1124430 [Suillus decipiens]|nr:hypothetical protein BDR04DRAFT_1124430 [Suillus decipiens]
MAPVRCTAIITIKHIVILSILMQNTNQRLNTLQSILRIFLQSMHTPQKVIDMLSHIGISISTDSIHAAVCSMSAESQNTLHTIGKSLLALYAYDNFNVDLKSQVPQAEKSNEILKHLTSSLLFMLEHGVTKNDLKCLEELSWKDLLHIHLELWDESAPKLSQCDQFNTQIFLSDNMDHYTFITAHAMDVNNSTVSGNVHPVVDLLAQDGIYDPDADILDNPDISQHVILIHGDLGTGEHLQSAQL